MVGVMMTGRKEGSLNVFRKRISDFRLGGSRIRFQMRSARHDVCAIFSREKQSNQSFPAVFFLLLLHKIIHGKLPSVPVLYYYIQENRGH